MTAAPMDAEAYARWLERRRKCPFFDDLCRRGYPEAVAQDLEAYREVSRLYGTETAEEMLDIGRARLGL